MREGAERRYSAPKAYGPVRLQLDRGRPASLLRVISKRTVLD